MLAILPRTVAADDAFRPVSFVRDVAPILIKHCQACHGPKTAESNYRLDSFDWLMKAGDFGEPPITPGTPEKSKIYDLITADDPDVRMPNNGGRLAESEIRTIAEWIQQGAKFDGASPTAPIREQVPRDIPHPKSPEVYPAPMPITAAAFTPDGNHLLVGGYHELLMWDLTSDQPPVRIGNMPERTFAIEFSPDKASLAIGGGSPGVEGEVRLIPWQNGPQAGGDHRVLTALEDVLFDIAFRPDGKQLATGAADGTVRVFDLAAGTERLKINNHSNWVTGVAYSADGKSIATASRDKTSKLFDAETGTLLLTHSEPTAAVRGVAFASAGKSVINAAGNRLVVWNVEDGKLIGEMPAFDGEIYAMSVAGDFVFAAALDRTVRQFKLADRSLVRTLTLPASWAVSLARNIPSHRLAAGGSDGSITIWDFETGGLVKQFVAIPLAAKVAK